MFGIASVLLERSSIQVPFIIKALTRVQCRKTYLPIFHYKIVIELQQQHWTPKHKIIQVPQT